MGQVTEEKQQEKVICVGLLAHVDAGKTTLSEAMLYLTGQIRTPGRVDHGNAYLDTDEQERERGITIFSKQARLTFGDCRITLLDTPGHVDFSAEMERALQVMDYAVLVVSGTDGVQGHTRTLWRLLRHYGVPVFLFINKMDLAGADREILQQQLKSELSDNCVDFTGMAAENPESTAAWYEELAVCEEELLNAYMESQRICAGHIRSAIAKRKVFPCFYGSALKLSGVDALLEGLRVFARAGEYPGEFSARVYKIGRDGRGARLTFLKVTGGGLKVKDRICYGDKEEKADQIRLYSGDKYETVETVQAGEVCAVTGLTSTCPGQGLGAEVSGGSPVLMPVLNYRIIIPPDIKPAELLPKLRELEEEDPQLHILWNEELQEIHAQMMGQVQTEVLARLIRERFGVAVSFGQGNIVYKETIARPVEGIGHFEPLRHYAEVHLLLSPGEPGSGVQVESACSEDVLDLNWQRLIATHVEEREHPGVLTGAPLTDVKVTILAGRAHVKHTEGGDFRQATYRAIRQGLKSGECVLLEPYYGFSLEVPQECVGRAMTDLKQRSADFEPPEFVTDSRGDMAVINGKGPAATLQDYLAEVRAYTQGRGELMLELLGYDVCHNSGEVIAEKGYDSEADAANPTGSVFCAHGAGFVVPWDEVDKYMHLERMYVPAEPDAGRQYRTDSALGAGEAEALSGVQRRKSWEKSVASMSSIELDRELADVYAREFGMSGEELQEAERKRWGKKQEQKPKASTVKLDKKGNPIYPAKEPKEKLLVVDGYNIIFAWQELKELAHSNLDSARDKLKDILCDYQGYEGCRLVVVFDAYRIRDNSGRKEFYDGRTRAMKKTGDVPGIEVVYTGTDETADAYIERLVHRERDKYRITVATNDGLEQLTVMSQGALRMSARGLREEIARVKER
ncbi:MAG: TetM/TetW/TetO/TetS family tetracycline resistance ribosomal protection protein [Blautia sp.]|nr:TetM/TetW/TetO/TetS family tetracycline resistance ribosomal protection protein [Blautia sp.]